MLLLHLDLVFCALARGKLSVLRVGGGATLGDLALSVIFGPLRSRYVKCVGRCFDLRDLIVDALDRLLDALLLPL